MHAILSAPKTFAAIAEDHLDDVYAYLVYLTGDRSLAEELAGDTFERALRSFRRFDPQRGSAKTWLCQVARSTALDHFRAERRRLRREEIWERENRRDADDSLADVGFSPELERALAALSASEREVVALRVVLDLDTETAARVLGISQTACSTRLSRALQKLEARLEETDVHA